MQSTQKRDYRYAAAEVKPGIMVSRTMVVLVVALMAMSMVVAVFATMFFRSSSGARPAPQQRVQPAPQHIVSYQAPRPQQR